MYWQMSSPFSTSSAAVRRQRPWDKSGYFLKGDFWFILAHSGAQMRQKSVPAKAPAEQLVKDIR
ncbi:hypothetical protein, partial [Methylocapsa palsarum]|uniref:hypothetical protein n=1 Tax=Methylocapsa palsarum TaxID=1612308 RepID=UPI001AECBDCC